MALQYACELLVDLEDIEGLCECQLPISEAEIERVLEGASDFLSLLAQMSLGRCTEMFRPCYDVDCRPCACACCRLYGIHLPGLEPEVTEVKINGSVVTTSEYVVMVNPMRQWVLERINAEGRSVWWPLRQVLTRASTEPDTFEITVRSGMARNAIMTAAAAEIACDTFKFLANQEYALPAGVVSAVAGGIAVEFRRFGDPTDQETMDIAGLAMTQRFLLTLPDKPTGTQILSPEMDDGWNLFQRR